MPQEHKWLAYVGITESPLPGHHWPVPHSPRSRFVVESETSGFHDALRGRAAITVIATGCVTETIEPLHSPGSHLAPSRLTKVRCIHRDRLHGEPPCGGIWRPRSASPASHDAPRVYAKAQAGCPKGGIGRCSTGSRARPRSVRLRGRDESNRGTAIRVIKGLFALERAI